jgi:hypothetical protein
VFFEAFPAGSTGRIRGLRCLFVPVAVDKAVHRTGISPRLKSFAYVDVLLGVDTQANVPIMRLPAAGGILPKRVPRAACSLIKSK